MADKADNRSVCKYGVKCYQKNPAHQAKYKHPPSSKRDMKGDNRKDDKKRRIIDTKHNVQHKDTSTSEDSDVEGTEIFKKKEEISDSENSNSDKNSTISPNVTQTKELLSESDESEIKEIMIPQKRMRVLDTESSDCDKSTNPTSKKSKQESYCDKENLDNRLKLSKEILDDTQKFIKSKFLVKMPMDFYQFWEFCQKIKPTDPCTALKDIDLELIGPFDVLAGKFSNVTKTVDEFLLHWRYYYDPPEFQTVLKSSSKSGFHMGYFRDEPKEMPVFIASNNARENGILEIMGPNLFAALNSYLKILKNSGNVFQKMSISKYTNLLNKEADRLQVELIRKSKSMYERDRAVVTKSFNQIGLVVPYNKKTQLGYRPLTLENKELKSLLSDLKANETDVVKKQAILAKLQPTLTFASIANDECDFGTCIELGWNILASGVDSLNQSISSFLKSSYELLNRDEFAKIVEAHMKSRKKGFHLSII